MLPRAIGNGGRTLKPGKLIARRSALRTIANSAALLGTAALGGCQTDILATADTKAIAPVPRTLRAKMATLNMELGSPILLRVFKVEAELEVWKEDRVLPLRAPKNLSNL